jgi:hypothetical protein
MEYFGSLFNIKVSDVPNKGIFLCAISAFSENDETQTQKLNLGRKIKKIGIFHQNFNCYGKVLLIL